MREHSEPKTMMPSYWENGELYMKNMLAYEAMQAFEHYGRKVHENQIDADVQEQAVELALSQSDGFNWDGVLAKHVRVPFARDCEKVLSAILLLEMKLESYDDPDANGIPYRLRTYREELERQHRKTGDHE